MSNIRDTGAYLLVLASHLAKTPLVTVVNLADVSFTLREEHGNIEVSSSAGGEEGFGRSRHHLHGRFRFREAQGRLSPSAALAYCVVHTH
jgi:hypothetical protein